MEKTLWLTFLGHPVNLDFDQKRAPSISRRVDFAPNLKLYELLTKPAMAVGVVATRRRQFRRPDWTVAVPRSRRWQWCRCGRRSSDGGRQSIVGTQRRHPGALLLAQTILCLDIAWPVTNQHQSSARWCLFNQQEQLSDTTGGTGQGFRGGTEVDQHLPDEWSPAANAVSCC